MRYGKAGCRHRKKTSKEFCSFAICTVSRGDHSMPLRAAQGKDLDSSHGGRKNMKEQSKAVVRRSGQSE